MKTLLATVIYKQARPYLEDLIKSIANQTDKDFSLLLINDNYEKEELAELKGEIRAVLPDTEVQLVDISKKHLSIPETRIEMLKEAKVLLADLVVLVDADDAISSNRIENYKKACELDKVSVFFYNNFITEGGEYVFNQLPASVDSIKSIAQNNFLGLSNTGIRIQKLTDDFLDSLKEGAAAVFDWYLFSRIVLDVGSGRYVKNADTIYRIYDNNTAGTSRDLEKEYRVKETHYSNLAKRYKYFEYMAAKLKTINKDSLQLSNNHQGYWWSDIKMEDTYEI